MARGPRLLVVDDEEANRDMLSRRLERNGFSVQAVETGRGALAAVEQGGVDLILLDSMMPGLSGIEVLKLLRAVHPPDRLPVIMVTAVSDSDRIAEALDLGANDYVTKPVDMTVALARIRSQIARKQAETALRVSEERYALAARGSNDGLWDWDLCSDRIYYSPRWKSMLGYADGEVGDSPEEWFGRVHPADLAGLRAAIDLHLNRGSLAFEHEFRMFARQGDCRWMLDRGLAVRDEEGRAIRMAGSQSDVTAKMTTDALTGLPNRIALLERLESALSSCGGRTGAFALLFLDLDRFKLVNDSLGHVTGDQLLIAVAARLRQVLGRSPLRALPARLGGDEFAIFLEGAGATGAAECAEQVLRSMRHAFHLDSRPVFCSVSIGIAVQRPDYGSAEQMLRDADTAMYAAKAGGKGRWAMFDGAMRDRVTARMQIENDLRSALEQQQLMVYYQPRVHLATGAICGFEALARWQHPERGMIGPDEFIPVAEETGLINELGLWVMRQACRQMAAWHQTYPSATPLEISVNISPSQCRDEHLAPQIEAILAETGLDPNTLQLEITESMLLEDLDHARSVLHGLKSLGVGLKIDDFGTGYSCLRYLCELPFDALKIDRSFTLNLAEKDNDSEELVKTILAMARNLRLEVVAEGVETQIHVDHLRAAGCEYGQGFYYSRPVDARTAEQLLAGGDPAALCQDRSGGSGPATA